MYMVKCISDSCYPGHFLKLRLETALFLHISFNGQNWMKFNYQKNSLWVSILHVLLLFEFGVLLTHSQVIVLSGSIVLVCSHNCEIVSWMQDETNVPAEHLQAVGGGKIEVGLLLISCQTSVLFGFHWDSGMDRRHITCCLWDRFLPLFLYSHHA